MLRFPFDRFQYNNPPEEPVRVEEKPKVKQTGKESVYYYPQDVVDRYLALLMGKPGKNDELQILAALRTINAGEANAGKYSMPELLGKFKKTFGIAADL